MDSENKGRARGALDVRPSEDTGDTNPSGLAFLLAGAAPISLLAAAALFAASDSTGLAVAVAVLIAVVAGIVALVGRFGVSPVWPILGFVTTLCCCSSWRTPPVSPNRLPQAATCCSEMVGPS